LFSKMTLEGKVALRHRGFKLPHAQAHGLERVETDLLFTDGLNEHDIQYYLRQLIDQQGNQIEGKMLKITFEIEEGVVPTLGHLVW